MEKHLCCICKQEFVGYGNNPWPIIEDEDTVCCDNCNATYVIPERIYRMLRKEDGTEQSK